MLKIISCYYIMQFYFSFSQLSAFFATGNLYLSFYLPRANWEVVSRLTAAPLFALKQPSLKSAWQGRNSRESRTCCLWGWIAFIPCSSQVVSTSRNLCNLGPFAQEQINSCAQRRQACGPIMRYSGDMGIVKAKIICFGFGMFDIYGNFPLLN